VVFPLPVKNNLSLQNPENNVYFVRACVEHMQILAEMYMLFVGKSLAGSYLYPAQCKIHLSIISSSSSSSSSYYTTLFC
jgi:hypothetical protein